MLPGLSSFAISNSDRLNDCVVNSGTKVQKVVELKIGRSLLLTYFNNIAMLYFADV